MKKILMAFDFDHTIINDNCDITINVLFPGGKVPSELKNSDPKIGWTARMQSIFKHLHANNVTKEQLLDSLSGILFSPGMKQFLLKLPADKVDLIIISDANSEFIKKILCDHDMYKLFQNVYTNTAEFDNTGLLNIRVYHWQDWCDLSAKNICKGSVLEEYIEEKRSNGVEYTHIGYVGDGANDFCPSMRLRKEDGLFARVDYHLIDHIDEQKKAGLHLTAPVHPWTDAAEIMSHVSLWCGQLEDDIVPATPRLLPPSQRTALS